MQVGMFFNELSSQPIARNASDAQMRAEQLVSTMRDAAAKGVKRVLRIPNDFISTPMATGYYWHDWLDDKRVQLELRQYFKSLSTKAPYLSDAAEENARWIELDFYHSGIAAHGIGACYVGDGLCISLPSSPAWDTANLVLEVHEIVGDEIEQRNENVHHASHTRHLAQHDTWIHKRMTDLASSGKELWMHSRDWFPHLVFCTDVGGQMTKLPAQSLPSIVRGLQSLNEYCIQWVNGPFDSTQIFCTVSPESGATLNLYSQERTFVYPCGTQKVFSWHAKLGHWRVHFDFDIGPGHLGIGYVGKHLRTVKFH